MSYFGAGPLSGGFMTRLFDMSPAKRIVVGVMFCVCGVILSIALWGAGIIWGLSLLPACAGIIAIVTGAAGLKGERERKQQVDLLRKSEDYFLGELVKLRNRRERAEWLKNEGFTDRLAIQEILDLARQHPAAPSRHDICVDDDDDADQ